MAGVVLLIEDDADLVIAMTYSLRSEGYQVRVAGTAHDGLLAATSEPAPDAIVLDLTLPDLSGIDVCRRLRSHERTRVTPIIICTAKGDEVDRIVGFEVGADDYCVKPVAMRELVLRIRALTRRASSTQVSSIVRFERLAMDHSAHRVWVDNYEIEFDRDRVSPARYPDTATRACPNARGAVGGGVGHPGRCHDAHGRYPCKALAGEASRRQRVHRDGSRNRVSDWRTGVSSFYDASKLKFEGHEHVAALWWFGCENECRMPAKADTRSLERLPFSFGQAEGACWYFAIERLCAPLLLQAAIVTTSDKEQRVDNTAIPRAHDRRWTARKKLD